MKITWHTRVTIILQGLYILLVWLTMWVCVCFSVAVYGRQWCRRLEDSHDIWADLLYRAGTVGVCHSPHPGSVCVHMDGAAGLHLHAVGGRRWRGHHPLHPHVPETLPNRQGHVAPQQAFHWCIVSEHRRPQQDQLQHTLCHEDSHDHMSRDCSAGVQHILLDHCCMDCARLWEVNTGWWKMDVTGDNFFFFKRLLHSHALWINRHLYSLIFFYLCFVSDVPLLSSALKCVNCETRLRLISTGRHNPTPPSSNTRVFKNIRNTFH